MPWKTPILTQIGWRSGVLHGYTPSQVPTWQEGENAANDPNSALHADAVDILKIHDNPADKYSEWRL